MLLLLLPLLTPHHKLLLHCSLTGWDTAAVWRSTVLTFNRRSHSNAAAASMLLLLLLLLLLLTPHHKLLLQKLLAVHAGPSACGPHLAGCQMSRGRFYIMMASCSVCNQVC
jgi:hypothetical protein